MRHTPTGSKRSSWHSTGMSMPACRAAAQMVVPSGTVTARPSMVSVTVRVSCSVGGTVSMAVLFLGRGRLGQQEVGGAVRIRASLPVQAAGGPVAVDHGPQGLRGQAGDPPGPQPQRLLQEPG